VYIMERRENSSKCTAAQNTEIYSPTNMCKHWENRKSFV